MFKKIIGGTLMIAGASFMVLPIADATPPNPAHKDYVCKYVGKPGTDERLQTGNNPIWVDTAATSPGWSFKDAQHSYVIVADTLKLNPEPSISQCPVVPPSPTHTMTHTTPPATTTTTTATKPPVTTTTTRPVVTPSATTTTPVTIATTTPPKAPKPQVNVPRGGVSAGDGSTLAATGFDPKGLFAGLVMLVTGLALTVGKRLTVLRK